MAEFTQPSEIARESLRRIAAKRLPPTPDNFRAFYHEIAGNQIEEPFPERELKAIARALPRNTPEAVRRANDFDRVVHSKNWQQLRRWLINSLQHDEDSPPANAPPAAPDPAAPPPLIALFSVLLGESIPVLLADHPTLVEEARQLATAFHPNTANFATPEFEHRLGAFCKKIEWAGEDQRAVREALLGLLQLMIQNISMLVMDDQWLHGQLAVLTQVVTGPLDIRTLDDVERRLRAVIDKQTHLKAELSDAQERLKSMLAGFIDRLAEFSSVTGDYRQSLAQGAEQIAGANSIDQLSEVICELVDQTRKAEAAAQRSHCELAELRGLVNSANQQIVRLQRELDETSELVRHDALTGTLNRKGLDEALEREISRARRRNTALAIGLLDIDNFKLLNDTHGHQVGDDALRHLSAVIRDHLRPQDSVGRYGGEEFVILLPDTELDDAVLALGRLQRELTRRYFLAENQKLLITFSAGVAQLTADESAIAAIVRADRAMYTAKRAGKNRVHPAA